MASARKHHPDPDGYYELVGRDQDRLNLAILRQTRRMTEKEIAERRKSGANSRPPNIEIDEKYARLMCQECNAIDPAAAFDAGFDGQRSIRMKGDFGFTDDGVFVVHNRMLAVLRDENVGGFEVTPVGEDWFAVKFTCIVASSPNVFKDKGLKCRTCGRPKEVIGRYSLLSEIDPPEDRPLLFTAQKMHIRGAGPWFRIDKPTPMLTGEVVSMLVDAKVKGGACCKLLTEKDVEELGDEAAERQTVVLR